MDTGFQFEVTWSDTDLYEVRVSGWSGSFGGVANVYVSIGDLAEAAAKLEGFPRNPLDTRELQFGEFGTKVAGGAIAMHFSCSDAAGHATVKVRIESEHDRAGHLQSAILIAAVEAAAVDEFVEDLRNLEAERVTVAKLRSTP